MLRPARINSTRNLTTEVTISPSQEIGATFGATGHLIPELDIGLTALGIVSASVFLNLDASATFNVSTASSTSPQPCVTATTDLNVGVGAQGSFFNFFNSSTASTSLFNKEFPLFQVRVFPCVPFFFFFLFLSPMNFDRNVLRRRIPLPRRVPLQRRVLLHRRRPPRCSCSI